MKAKQQHNKPSNPRKPGPKSRTRQNGKSLDFSEVDDDEITVIAPAKYPRRMSARTKD
jgi:hypothetical protein